MVEYINIDATVLDSQNNVIYIKSVIRDASNNWNVFMNILFNTIWTRNVGFSTIDLGKLLPGLRVIMPIMMFIGSAPVKDSVILFRLT